MVLPASSLGCPLLILEERSTSIEASSPFLLIFPESLAVFAVFLTLESYLPR